MLERATVGDGISRRRFLRDAGIATAATAELLALPATATARHRPHRRRPAHVVVIGGGVAGLTAAHELVDRGFSVTVLERNGFAGLGGKARSIPVPNTGTGGRSDLPGEHGFRIFFGFYQHLTESMRRIPFGHNPNGVWDNLEDTAQGWICRDGGRAPIVFPYGQATLRSLTPVALEQTLLGLFTLAGVPATETAFFVSRLLMYMTSSPERRFGEWEYMSWWNYVQASTKSHDYQQVWGRTFVDDAQAIKSKEASTRSTGLWLEQLIFNILGIHKYDGSPIRVLNAPTNEAFIHPWIALLRRRGVRFLSAEATALDTHAGRITGVTMIDPRRRRSTVHGDWFVCALPWDRAIKLWSPAILRTDPFLGRSAKLRNGWMVGHQLFLRERLDINRGHLLLADSPWALVSVQQGRLWNRDLPGQYGDGSVKDIISTCISDWDTPGIVYDKPARDCTTQEISTEVLAQVNAHLKGAGFHIPDRQLRTTFLDPDVRPIGVGVTTARNETPLFLNTVGCLDNRPTQDTKVPNLFVASDYTRTNMDVACMESAAEAGRRAVNFLLDRARSKAPPADVFTQFDPPELQQLKALDAERYKQGQPHILEAGGPIVDSLFR